MTTLEVEAELRTRAHEGTLVEVSPEQMNVILCELDRLRSRCGRLERVRHGRDRKTMAVFLAALILFAMVFVIGWYGPESFAGPR